ncbi:MAG: twin-arginine translocation signal domain-containing protein, partial [Mariniphaga sp.]
MNKNFNSRRDFIKKSAGVSAGLMVGGVLPGFSAESYRRI